MTTWYTADTHFGHANIITHCSRPFTNADEMNEAIIARWNAIVAKSDTVYHLGDVLSFKHKEMGEARGRALLDRLNGTMTIAWGNHDDHCQWLKSRYHTVDYMDTRVEGQRLVMCHYPFESWNGRQPSHPGNSIHIHGHTHGMLRKMAGRVDVGVDCWGFNPVSLEEIVERARLGG